MSILSRLAASVLVVVITALSVAAASGASASSAETPFVFLAAESFSHSNSKDGSAILAAADVQPGDSTVGTVEIGNRGGLPGRLTVSQSRIDDLPGPNGGALSRKLRLAVVDVTSESSPVTVYSGKLERFTTASLGRLDPGESKTYRFTLSFPDGGIPRGDAIGDNAYQGSSVRVRYGWVLSLADPAG